jgi:hypothetical protein
VTSSRGCGNDFETANGIGIRAIVGPLVSISAVRDEIATLQEVPQSGNAMHHRCPTAA